MPRENRKRGKKHKKSKEEDDYAPSSNVEQQKYAEEQPEIGHGEPSWIRPSARQEDEFNPEAPFGYVEQDVKAYFRTVDVQIRDWQDNAAAEEVSEDTDPNEQKRLFFVAALNEMREKEKQLATDPDCSVILERMAHSMDDFVRRVFVDSLAGSFEILSKHRFASHVVQTLFVISRETVARETRGIFPADTGQDDKGELLPLTRLILDVCEELLPNLASLVIDPFASHVLRALFLLLSPSTASEDDNLVRSKRSSAWKAKQGSMKSLFTDNKGKQREDIRRSVPAEFTAMARRFIEQLRSGLSGNEVRAMAASKVASPCLKVILGVESDLGMSTSPNSNSTELPEPSDFVGTLLRDPTSSHLLEEIVARCPDSAYGIIWQLYFKGSFARLGIHPVANFVASKAIERCSAEQLGDVAAEMETGWVKSVRTARTGVLRAFVDRAAALKAKGEEAKQAVLQGFNLPDSDPTIIHCILTVLTYDDYKSYKADAVSNPGAQNEARKPHHHSRRGGPQQEADPLAFKTQGSILLQSLLKLPEPHVNFVINPLLKLPVEDKIKLCHDPSASRVYDAFLESPDIQSKCKRQFVMDFIGHYHELVDDRIGSRVVDRCWAFCDTYLKEKIARSLIKHEQNLAGSFYGKYFARKLNLFLLQRRPEEWRNIQSQSKAHADQQAQAQIPQQGQHQNRAKSNAKGNHTADGGEDADHDTASPPNAAKRKRDNEIEDLFDAALGRKIKKAALGDGVTSANGVAKEQDTRSMEGKSSKKKRKSRDQQDPGLAAVLGAIRQAPKNEESRSKKKKKQSHF
ncbi:armadillo-type protein [Coprinopsis sp. MPI-PUGE-AT-0042]|nr:armadillo-type protein [Coprinopsis sp. MPI-PUGE-AT-0042]